MLEAFGLFSPGMHESTMRSVRTRSATNVSPPLFRMKGVKGFWRLDDWAIVVSWLGFNPRRDLTSQLVAA